MKVQTQSNTHGNSLNILGPELMEEQVTPTPHTSAALTIIAGTFQWRVSDIQGTVFHLQGRTHGSWRKEDNRTRIIFQ